MDSIVHLFYPAHPTIVRPSDRNWEQVLCICLWFYSQEIPCLEIMFLVFRGLGFPIANKLQ